MAPKRRNPKSKIRNGRFYHNAIFLSAIPACSARDILKGGTQHGYRYQKLSGTDIPYITHPMAVGIILAKAGCSDEIIVVGTRNGDLTANDVTPHSNKKVWWVCKNGHEWKSLINNRSLGVGCPICAGRNQ